MKLAGLQFVKNKAIWFAVALSFACFFTRVINVYDLVFSQGPDTVFLGMDPYFYLRHVETCFKNYPSVQKFDHATHYPSGTIADACGLYTLGMASVCKLILRGEADSDDIARVIAWIPPVLGAICCFLIYLIGFQLRGPLAGILASLIYLFFPGLSLPRSVLGFPDHHIVEIVLCLWILWGLIRLVKPEKAIKIPEALIYSLPLALIFFVWPGAPLYLIITGLAVWLYYTFSDHSPREIKFISQKLIAYFLSVCGLLLLSKFIIPDLWTVVNPELQNKVIAGFAALALVIPAYLVLDWWIKKYTGIRPVFISTLLFAISLLLLYILFNYTKEGKEIVFWFHFKASFLTESPQLTTGKIFYNTGLPGIVALSGALVYFVYHIISERKHPIIILVTFTAVFSYMWVNTYDMGYMISPFTTTLSALVFWDIVTYITTRRSSKKKSGSRKSTRRPVKRRSGHKLLIPALVLTFVLFLLFPLIWRGKTHPFWVDKTYRVTSRFYSESLFRATDWMKHHTPELALKTDSILPAGVIKEKFTYPEGTYGVMTAWDYGNIVNQRGHRIPVWSRWAGGPHSHWSKSTSEEESLTNLCPSCKESEGVKYVILDSKMAGPFFIPTVNLTDKDPVKYRVTEQVNYQGSNVNVTTYGPLYEQSITSRLYKYDGNNLSHYRLIWDSKEMVFVTYYKQNNKMLMIDIDINTDEELMNYQRIANLGYYAQNNIVYYKGFLSPKVKIFEVVPGALIDAFVQPNSRARISLQLKSNSSNRVINYNQQEVADQNGAVRFVVPYPTEFDPLNSHIAPDAHYLFFYTDNSGEQKTTTFEVSEFNVYKRDTIRLEN